MTLDELNRQKAVLLREYRGKFKYLNIILSYTATGCTTSDSNSKYPKIHHSTQKVGEKLVINYLNKKPQIIIDKFDQ